MCKKIGDFIKEAPILLFSNCILAVNRCHVSDQVKNLVRITDFVVVPRYNLTKVSVKAIPALASKIEVRVSPKKSEETTASSV